MKILNGIGDCFRALGKFQMPMIVLVRSPCHGWATATTTTTMSIVA